MKKKSKLIHIKKYISILLIISVSVLTGCLGTLGSDDVTLKTVSMFGGTGDDARYYQDLLAEFTASEPDIKLEDSSETSTEEWKQSTVESFNQTETTPDVIFYFTGIDARKLILDNQFVSIDEILQVYPDYAANIRPAAMDYVREFDGNTYSVPVRGFWEGLFCNQDLFDRYGLELPYDWDSFLLAVDTFHANQIPPVAVSFKEIPHYWIEHMILAEGGFVEHSLNPYQYVPESWVRSMNLITELQNRGAFTDQADTMMNADAVTMFTDKKAAMLLEGSWTMGLIKDADTTTVIPFPKTPGGKKEPADIISGYSTGYYITRKAWDDPKKRDAAVRFVTSMTSNDSIAYICKAGGAPAADITASGTPTTLDKSVTILQENAKNAIMPIDSKMNKEAWKYLCSAVVQIAKGEITGREVITKLSEINEW